MICAAMKKKKKKRRYTDNGVFFFLSTLHKIKVKKKKGRPGRRKNGSCSWRSRRCTMTFIGCKKSVIHPQPPLALTHPHTPTKAAESQPLYFDRLDKGPRLGPYHGSVIQAGRANTYLLHMPIPTTPCVGYHV